MLIRIKDYELLSDKLKAKPYLALSNFFNAYAKSINKMYGRTGSLFQKHMPRKRVENEDYLRNLIGYIHLNPVKHKFTDDFKSYLFSSYVHYMNEDQSFVSQDYILGIFDGVSNFKNWHDANQISLIDKLDGVE